jgi:hypothetical protein
VTHFVLTTLWDSLGAIRGFAGDDYTRARYYPEDDDYLLDREPFVLHYEVLADREPRRSAMLEQLAALLGSLARAGLK